MILVTKCRNITISFTGIVAAVPRAIEPPQPPQPIVDDRDHVPLINVNDIKINIKKEHQEAKTENIMESQGS